MVGLRADHISRVPAHYAPTVPAGWKAHLILNIDCWNVVVHWLIDGVELQVCDAFANFLCFRLVIFCILFVGGLGLLCLARVVRLLTAWMGLLGLALQRVDPRLVQAYVVNHVLHNGVDVLVLIREGHLERVIEGWSRDTRRYR